MHERLVGKSVASLVKDCLVNDRPLYLDGCDTKFLEVLAPRQVVATNLGVCGDSHIGKPFYSLLAEGEARDSLVRSENHYRFSMKRQLIKRTSDRLIVSYKNWSGTPCEAYDNRQVLPPFMPYQRAEDCIFGQLVELSSAGYFGYLPWAIWHSRTSDHNYKQEDLLEDSFSVIASDIVRAILKTSLAIRSVPPPQATCG